jgi:hypothetical protein
MQFYPKRTVEEQAERLPPSYQESYLNSHLDRIEIDGCEIHGYFEYSFMEEKSYHEQPTRSQDGSIIELDNYTTFLTPRLIIKYNMMGIDDYRTLMTFLKSKNAFNVTCYDIVADRRVTHEMYFANPQMPIIYQRYLAVMGIQDYTIELIGTNRKTEDMKITFYIDGIENEAYSNDTWLSFILRGETGYKIMYSNDLKKFIVTNDNGITALYYGKEYVSPHDMVVSNRYYGVVRV